MSIAERLAFRSEPELNSGCRLWNGTTDQDGYGLIWIGGLRFRAHRIAWSAANGSIPPGMFVCHRCDTTACVNPDHLWVGTSADNVADRVAKGRSWNGGQQGERNAGAKITTKEALAIVARLDAGERYLSIAQDFGISTGTVRSINAGETWAEFTGRLPVNFTGQGTKGEWNGSAKIAANDIATIISRLDAGDTCSEIARAYGVNAPAISKIKAGRTWSHVTGRKYEGAAA